jgi:hypothetical protein
MVSCRPILWSALIHTSMICRHLGHLRYKKGLQRKLSNPSMTCRHLGHLRYKMGLQSTLIHPSMIYRHLGHLRYKIKCLHLMLGWLSADPSNILNGQDVYMSCLDGLVKTILYLKWPRCLHIKLALSHPRMICRHLDHLKYKIGLQ